MNKSENIGLLAKALSAAQANIKGAVKDSLNPFFKNKYADLTSVWEACRAELAANQLAVAQVNEVDGTQGIVVETVLMHSSGEWISGKLRMVPVKNDPQGIGSCITYARRYALAAMVGVCPEDDDGQAASQPERAQAPRETPPPVTRSAPADTTQHHPGEEPSAAKEPTAKAFERFGNGAWRDVILHFSKHKGKRLGDLEPKSLRWFRKEWSPKPYNGTVSGNDLDLRAALDVCDYEHENEKLQERKQDAKKLAPPPDQDMAEEDIPF